MFQEKLAMALSKLPANATVKDVLQGGILGNMLDVAAQKRKPVATISKDWKKPKKEDLEDWSDFDI